MVIQCRQSGSGWVINNLIYVPNDSSNRYFEKVQEWIAAGNTPDPQFSSAEMLSNNRKQKIADIKNEALARIVEGVPALNSIPMIDLMMELWPGLDTASLGADMILAKDIYVYARSKINAARSATQAQLDSYDPSTDESWPI